MVGFAVPVNKELARVADCIYDIHSVWFFTPNNGYLEEFVKRRSSLDYFDWVEFVIGLYSWEFDQLFIVL